jgi:hypothetical protein
LFISFLCFALQWSAATPELCPSSLVGCPDCASAGTTTAGALHKRGLHGRYAPFKTAYERFKQGYTTTNRRKPLQRPLPSALLALLAMRGGVLAGHFKAPNHVFWFRSIDKIR